ncbi:Asp-tRNA(Asn)/Glu-tRNA(Gln) amidotransferase subunit GatB [Nitrosomonas halophila]|uniref:Aspartyl/glutamyl-tRNA(Asn/Gln) amidotransferase subunit B n=1 Tax=Nitrosomonas halophila TaxID=44576 RepID=A0A1H3E3A0_9PROT|nr:Asp-tRNA(Asn)/Glu-tRNA(Gln) amidotransferase subunit GatB [Nitrosomonas halophila]SDX73107.1 aspartyl-tRNA(Asn)/glutamyl-tRNA(Gln) amidotransferase subunit B [Nitrosomonas halophila]
MQWEIVIGLEIHAQLSTRSKIFSGASIAYGARPNSQACAVDIALPGVLPVLNQGAVERAIKFGLAIDAKINSPSIFARKNYFYPDLPKGYQISQFERPIVEGGHVSIQVGDREKTIRLTRAHLEEDAGKSMHEDFHGMTGIDLNRAGTALLEIVSEPDMRSSAEAVAYAKTLHSLVRWIGICDGNMQEGSFRCDANVSVRPLGTEKLGTRCEIKNLNSFRFLERAIDHEVARQIDILEEGGRIIQQTRLYDADRDETRSMRSKEDAQDYRYFPDPDLLPVVISGEWIEHAKKSLPELPEDKRSRYVKQHGLSAYDASVLTVTRELSDYFDQTVEMLPGQGKLSANWIMGEVSGRLNKEGLEIAQCPVNPEQLAGLLRRISDGTVSGKMAREVFDSIWSGEGNDADAIIAAKGLKQISDDSEIEKLVDDVLIAHPQQVADYQSGKEKAFNSLVGQVMKVSKGKANPAQVNSILKRKLSE